MKTTIAAILIATASVAHANLIDLTPGGFNADNAPPAFYQFIAQWSSHQIDFFDEATPDGWVSLYGILNGGTYFNTDLIGNPGQSAGVSWDFSSLPGWSMSRMLIFGRAADGTPWDNLYAVPHSFLKIDALETVWLHEGVDISSISFFGRWPGSPAPDGGSTLLLAALGLALLAALKTVQRNNPHARPRRIP
jgi:hypothetical protein